MIYWRSKHCRYFFYPFMLLKRMGYGIECVRLLICNHFYFIVVSYNKTLEEKKKQKRHWRNSDKFYVTFLSIKFCKIKIEWKIRTIKFRMSLTFLLLYFHWVSSSYFLKRRDIVTKYQNYSRLLQALRVVYLKIM